MKQIILAVTLLAAVSLAACTASPPTAAPTTTSDIGADSEIRDLVENFGKRLQTVSLLAPDAAQELQEQYSEFVAPSLLEMWINDASKAPGRMVSSPWPDRIEITTLAREAPDRYVINGFVVEMTSVEMVNGGAADKIPVHLIVERDQGRWLITEYTEEH